MLSLEEFRRIDPEFKDMPDKELIKLRDAIYAFVEPILDEYIASVDTKPQLKEIGKVGNVD